MCSHRREKHCTGAGERSEADNAQNDGAAQGGYAVTAVTWILQDFQSTVDRRASGEGVGHVGETILVERSGDQQPDRNRDGGRHDRWHQVPKSGGGSSDSRPDQCADNWEPDDAGGHIRLAPQSDRDSCQELNGGEQAQPNHSPKVGTSVMPRARHGDERYCGHRTRAFTQPHFQVEEWSFAEELKQASVTGLGTAMPDLAMVERIRCQYVQRQRRCRDDVAVEEHREPS